MLALSVPVALISAAIFGGLVLMSDRKRGAFLAQAILFLGAVLIFVAIVAARPILGLTTEALAAIATAVMSAAVAGMLYHLYLGRFERVWAARGVFLAVYLIVSALFGFVFLSLI
jgi:hypothetical protein